MLSLFRLLRPAALTVAAAHLLCQISSAVSWKPITPEELAAEARLDPEAGVEILLREMAIDDTSVDSTVFRHYIRMKVFNDRGVAALDKVELFGTRDFRVRDIAARVIKPDGSILPVDSKSIYTRDAIRRGSLKVQVKAFSFPGLEPGCVIEYQWDEVAIDDAGGIFGLTLRPQHKYPSWVVRFRLRPSGYIPPTYELRTIQHNFQVGVPKPDRSGYFNFELTDVPALKEEPWMPPDDAVESWLLFYYAERGQKPEEYWKDLAKGVADYVDRRIKPDKSIQALAKQLADGATDDDARLQRYYDYCRTKIANISTETSGLTPEQIAKLKANKSASSTLARGSGTALDINMLFLALASVDRLPARMARVNDRSERFFDKQVPVRFMLPDLIAAVKVGETWRFFDPGSPYQPFGSLSWKNEAVPALICDAKNHEFVTTQIQPAEASRAVRRAAFELDEEGTLSGTVTLEFFGHAAVMQKSQFDTATADGAATIIRDGVHARLGTAEVSDIVVEGADDPIKPITINYKVRVPEYAERTGRRLMLVPCFFEKGRDALFKTETRDFGVYFPYLFFEEDHLEIRVPEGFALEEASSPRSVQDAEAMRYKASIAVTKSGRKLFYHRHYLVNGLYFRPEFYPGIKVFHDVVHSGDHHVLVLKKADEKPAVETANSP